MCDSVLVGVAQREPDAADGTPPGERLVGTRRSGFVDERALAQLGVDAPCKLYKTFANRPLPGIVSLSR